MQLKLYEVATLFGVSENTVYRWVREDNLPAQLVNSQYSFHRAELIEWATLQHIDVPRSLLARVNGDFRPGEFADALEAGSALYDVPGDDKPSVLGAVVQQIPKLQPDERESLLALLLTRERAGSTTVGDGIAIPHPSRPLVLAADQPTVTLCFLSNPQAFAGPQGQAVSVLFMIVASNVRNHLHLLAQLASALRDAEFRAAVMRHASFDEILSHARRLNPSPS